MKIVGYEWDDGNWPKCGKHGVTKQEIEEIFSNTPSVYPDTNHSQEETRQLAIGKTNEGTYVFIAFTIRMKQDESYIRPISARYMHRKEIEHYEQR